MLHLSCKLGQTWSVWQIWRLANVKFSKWQIWQLANATGKFRIWQILQVANLAAGELFKQLRNIEIGKFCNWRIL